MLSGANVDFIFNSLQKYESGISYPNYTKIGVKYVRQPLPSGSDTTWIMQFYANTPTIIGSGTNYLDLDVIKLTAVYQSEKDSAYLSSAYQTLVKNGKRGDFNSNVVTISYECGITNTLLYKKPDFYTVDIILVFSAP